MSFASKQLEKQFRKLSDGKVLDILENNPDNFSGSAWDIVNKEAEARGGTEGLRNRIFEAEKKREVEEREAEANRNREIPESKAIPQEVSVKDFDMPFAAMVWFMVKWSIATIPALIILFFIGLLLLIAVGGSLSSLVGGL